MVNHIKQIFNHILEGITEKNKRYKIVIELNAFKDLIDYYKVIDIDQGDLV